MDKKNSPDSMTKALLTYEQIQAKVTAANEHLRHLQNEVGQVERSLKMRREELVAQTQELLAARRSELADEEQQAKTRLEAITSGQVAARNELTGLQRQKTALEADLIELQEDMQTLAGRRDAALQALREAENELETKKAETNQAQARTSFLQGEHGPLEQSLATLRTSIAAQEQVLDELNIKEAQVMGRFETKKRKIELEIGDLLTKQEQLEFEHARLKREFGQMSEELAVRLKNADDRETILKQREAKVRQDEKVIARNAQLLNL